MGGEEYNSTRFERFACTRIYINFDRSASLCIRQKTDLEMQPYVYIPRQ
jgi:hypothetical protein